MKTVNLAVAQVRILLPPLLMTLLSLNKLKKASKEDLEKEYRRLHKLLVAENSAVKNRDDLLLHNCMEFIKLLLKDQHGVPSGELVKLDNKNYEL